MAWTGTENGDLQNVLAIGEQQRIDRWVAYAGDQRYKTASTIDEALAHGREAVRLGLCDCVDVRAAHASQPDSRRRNVLAHALHGINIDHQKEIRQVVNGGRLVSKIHFNRPTGTGKRYRAKAKERMQ